MSDLTYGEQHPKGEMTCFQCGERHVAEYHHEGRYGEGSIYAVVCSADGLDLTDWYTADVIDFDPALWTDGVARQLTAADIGLDLS